MNMKGKNSEEEQRWWIWRERTAKKSKDDEYEGERTAKKSKDDEYEGKEQLVIYTGTRDVLEGITSVLVKYSEHIFIVINFIYFNILINVIYINIPITLLLFFII